MHPALGMASSFAVLEMIGGVVIGLTAGLLGVFVMMDDGVGGDFVGYQHAFGMLMFSMSALGLVAGGGGAALRAGVAGVRAGRHRGVSIGVVALSRLVWLAIAGLVAAFTAQVATDANTLMAVVTLTGPVGLVAILVVILPLGMVYVGTRNSVLPV